jgi:hypothetical protein
MNKRELILAGALGVAAAGAAAQAQTLAGPKRVADRKRGSYIPNDRGEQMVIMFTTSTDLNAFMPPGLKCVDPHRAFIKGQRKKGQGTSGKPGLQICITTMAVTPQFGVRQRNILMWEGSPAGIGSSLAGVKRWGYAEMTHVFEQDRKLIAQGSPSPFFLDVQADGYPLMSFAGMLDGKKRVEAPPYLGMYIGGEPGADLLSLTFDDSTTGRPLHGTGSLTFGSMPIETAPANPSKDWPATLLKDIKVEGCVYEELTFTRTYGTEFETIRKAFPAPSLAK